MSEIKSIFDLDEFKPYKKTWVKRLNTLSTRANYYDGSIYGNVRESLGWLAPRIYKNIKPLFLPLSRAVDIDSGIIPGGWKLPADDPKTETWQQAVDTVFDWSAWDTDGVLFVHYGAEMGLSGLKIADIRTEKRVIIQPIDPTLFMLIGMSMYDEAPDMCLFVEKRTGQDGKEFEYAEVIDPANIRTYANGKEQGFDDRDPVYKNELGFVPFVEVRHIETGQPYGEATFQKSITLLDEVNALASQLAVIIQRHSEPQWAVSGAEASDLKHGGESVWFLPEGAEAKILVPQIDIDGVLAFIQEIGKGVKESLPELAFDDLKARDQVATRTVELQLMELILKVKRTRPNYDRGLTTALKMAGRAANTLGVPEIGVLDDDELMFDANRAILPPDELGQIQLETARLELEQLQNSMIDEGADAQP